MRRTVIAFAAAALSAAMGCPKEPEKPGKPSTIADAGADAGAAVPGDSLAQVTEAEPNDSPQSAQKITESSRITGQIAPVQPATRPDEDWYLVAPAVVPQDLSIAISSEIPGGTSVEVYDRDHNRISSLTLGASPGAAVPGRVVPFPQLRVRDQLLVRIASPKSSGKYTLELKLTAPDPDREAEPNDKPIDATPLPLDHPMHGFYETEGDQDFYVVDLAPSIAPPAAPAPDAGASDASVPVQPPAPPLAPDASVALTPAPPTSLLRLCVTAIPGIRHALTVFDENQVPFATFQSRDVGGPLDVRDLPLRATTTKVTLLLESAPQRRKRPASDQPYTLTVKRESAPPDVELEPNDSFALATPIVPLPGPNGTSTAKRTGWLSPVGDADIYKLHLDGPARLHVVLSALDRVDTELEVLDVPNPQAEKGISLLKVNEGGPKEPEVIPAITLPAGDHYLKVVNASHKVGDKWVRDQEDPDQNYTLELTLSPDDGAFEREPNETAATATPLVVGHPLSGYLFPSKDVDVYKIDLSAQPIAAGAKITVTGVTRVPVWTELHDADGDKLGELLNSADPGKPGLDAVIQQKLSPGIYYLVVKPHPTSRTPGAPLADPETAYQVSIDVE